MSDQPFPPADPAAFLALCAGEWMSLRSSFELSSGGDDDWH
ncbi:MAG: phycobiliprotein lyase, partial [Synechococcus sp.]